jgi:penicillin amidase
MHVTSPVVAPRKSKVAFRSVILVLGLLLIAFLLFDLWFYRAVRASLPQRDGTMRLAGLSAPVIVTYDRQGVPNIVAANLPDLFFAQGYITAQDRLWQMDMTRRYASGDLAVILGPEYVKYDREHRILGLLQVAQRAAANMDAQQRAHFDAYAAGVNAYIEQHRRTLPLEFRFMQYFPHAWTAEDSILVGLAMAEFLNHGEYKAKLGREKVLAKLGPELTADLYVNTSWRDHAPGSESNSLENPAPDASFEDDEQSATPSEQQVPFGKLRAGSPLRARPPAKEAGGRIVDAPVGMTNFLGDTSNTLGYIEHVRPGSNNWVVSGSHTASGKPLLSNDMHLMLSIPNTWYEAHLTAGDFDVAGVTLPGVPYVIVGHNRRIAWGFTNLGPDVEDIYVEKFNERGEYLTPQGWVQPEHRHELIRVKGSPEVALDVVTTRHGPIISDIIPGEQRKLALKWTIFDPHAFGNVFFAVDSAQNWQEFQAAFSHFGAPGQNVVYGDVDGHIGYQATGFVPIRAGGDGSVPVPGDDDAHEWTGYVPYDKLPSVYDPLSGIIATANSRITLDNYPYQLSMEWMPPYRTQRIYKLLSAPKKFTPADMLAMQMDVVSAFDLFCAQRFVYAVDHSPKASPRAKSAADIMRKWDGKMDVESVAATIAYLSRENLQEILLKSKLGDQWREYRWFMSPVWLENVLAHQPARWLPQGYANYDDLLAAAVDATVSDAGVPHALATWKWGRVHHVDVTHPFWSHFPILKRVAGTGSQPFAGDALTVKQATQQLAPSERLTVDFSHLDESTLNIVNGQSGDPFDEHYNDQWDAYYHGTTFPLPFSPDAVQHAAAHHLRLEPQ